MKKNLKYLKKIEKLNLEIKKEKQKLIDSFEKYIDEFNLMEILTVDRVRDILEQIYENKNEKEIIIMLSDDRNKLSKNRKEDINDETIETYKEMS
ncbi:hypothetical protein [Sneathia sanguinegens]|jgi:hypothetical protein|uniref:hypothetical protein n=1 Tax=Sneathia sanguinegens TaxID=40543 RepID=UPI002587B336|nr:hypothetical protein [Sneathia sanguinegens]MDU4652159.1 hypothetical protein [Sneathia sanguinegens]